MNIAKFKGAKLLRPLSTLLLSGLLFSSLYAAPKSAGGFYLGVEAGAGLMNYELSLPSTNGANDKPTESKNSKSLGTLVSAAFNMGYRSYFSPNFGLKTYASVLYATGSPKMKFDVNADKLASFNHSVTDLTASLNFDFFFQFPMGARAAMSPFIGIGVGYSIIDWGMDMIMDGTNLQLSSTINAISVPLNVGIDIIIAESHILSISSRIPVFPISSKSVNSNSAGNITRFSKASVKPKIYYVMAGYSYKF